MQKKMFLHLWRRYWWLFEFLGAAAVAAILICSAVNLTTISYANETTDDVLIEESSENGPFVQLIPEPEDLICGYGIAEDISDPVLPALQSMEVPSVDTSVKTYMSYRTITSKSSMQYKLQKQAHTNQYGFREINGMYLVALGTYYTDHAGSMFRVTLKNGTTFDVIAGDVKADKDTDSKNQHRSGNVIEFIVDTKKLSQMARIMGDVSYTPDAGLTGPIQSIAYLGEYDAV